MRAGVVESTDLPVLATQDDHRVVGHVEDEEVARILHVGHGAGIEPHRLEHDLGVELERLFARVEP
jgi:hypothetical protein